LTGNGIIAMSMKKDQTTQPILFDEFVTNAPTIFDQVAAGKQVTVERGNQLVRLSRVRRANKRAQRHFSADDALWDIVGTGRSTGPTEVSSDKHRYLANAAADLHRPDHHG
ncbi:MAG: hypothetical protein ACRDID_01930, partial [Ktedonobacterales bacterium]